MPLGAINVVVKVFSGEKEPCSCLALSYASYTSFTHSANVFVSTGSRSAAAISLFFEPPMVGRRSCRGPAMRKNAPKKVLEASCSREVSPAPPAPTRRVWVDRLDGASC